LHEQKLAVHRYALKLVAVGKDKVGLELQPALTKSAKHADDVVSRE
jgi:hypothetical protein